VIEFFALLFVMWGLGYIAGNWHAK